MSEQEIYLGGGKSPKPDKYKRTLALDDSADERLTHRKSQELGHHGSNLYLNATPSNRMHRNDLSSGQFLFATQSIYCFIH